MRKSASPEAGDGILCCVLIKGEGVDFRQMRICHMFHENKTSSGRFSMAGFNEEHKREVHEKQFPRDLENAFSMGARLSRGEV